MSVGTKREPHENQNRTCNKNVRQQKQQNKTHANNNNHKRQHIETRKEHSDKNPQKGCKKKIAGVLPSEQQILSCFR